MNGAAPGPPIPDPASDSSGSSRSILSVEGLSKTFPSRGRAGRGLGEGEAERRAVDGVSFQVEEGETLGLVGESGSGKTTTARCVLRLIEPDAGRILFEGKDVRAMEGGDLLRFRRRVQIVFQDPYGSLNPRLRPASALDEVLRVHGLGGEAEGRARRVSELLECVRLSDRHGRSYPHELSGGERQRVGIARALAVEPRLIVLDEPVSALDVSVRAQIVNLLHDLQSELRLTYLFIAHDLALVEHVSDRVAVMWRGRIVELGSAEEVYARPRHPHTRALLSALPASIGGEGVHA